MNYDIHDAKQASIGAIVASLMVALIRSGEPINIDPTKGLIVGLVWMYIVTSPFITSRFETKVHAFWNVVVTLIITSAVALVFDMVTIEQIKSFSFFGSSPWILAMVALPTSNFWDKYNITNQYEGWYLKRRR